MSKKDSTTHGNVPAAPNRKPYKQAKFNDQHVAFGRGGEVHQTADHEHDIMTTQQGTPVSDDQNTLRVGARGPAALEDFHFREKLFHFDHERIPERVVHARGYGVHGFSNFMSPSPSIPTLIFCSAKAKKHQHSSGFLRWPAIRDRLIWRAMCVALP